MCLFANKTLASLVLKEKRLEMTFSTAGGYSQQQHGGKETEDNNSRDLLIFYSAPNPGNIKEYFHCVLLPKVWLF